MKYSPRALGAVVFSILLIFVIFLVLTELIKSYDSTKDSSASLRFGMAISVLFMSALANVMGDLYIKFLTNSFNTSGSISPNIQFKQI